MLRDILSGPIRPIQLMLAAPDETTGGGALTAREPGNGVLEAGNFSAASTTSEDEAPPDWGALGEKHGESSEVPAVQPETTTAKPPDTTTTEPPVKPAAVPPNPAKPKTDRNANTEEAMPEIPASKPQPTGKADHPTDPNRYVDGTFKPGKEPKPAETTPPAAKPAETPKPAETAKPPGEEPKPEAKTIPKDDADIDAMEPKPTASEKTKNDFKTVKQIAKDAREEARRFKAEADELRAKVGTELPEDVKQKLARYDELEKFEKMFLLENEPKSRAEYASKLTTAEDSFLNKLINDPRIKLAEKGEDGPFKSAEYLKKVGFDSPEGTALINSWIKAIRENTGDELLAQEIVDSARGRARIVQERNAEIERLRADQGGYLRERQEKEKGEFNQWGSEADKTLVELAKGHEWADFMKEPENATPEQKAFIATHNERVKSTVVPAFNAAVLDVFQRKPSETVTHVFNSMRLQHEVLPELERVKGELSSAQTRITELEGLANGVRQVSQVSQAEQAPSTPVTTAPNGIAGASEVSSDDSIDAFLIQKGIRK